MTVTEVALVVAGLTMGAFSLRAGLRTRASEQSKRMLCAGGWALLLALPYFVTYFWSYSYHYRLGFAIVPLVIAAKRDRPVDDPDARQIAVDGAQRARRAYYLAICCLSLPGIVAVATNVSWSSLVAGGREAGQRHARKYQVFNPSLLEVVFGLEDYLRDTGEAPVVLAPGEERLPFFFPQMQIIDRPVTTLAEYEALGATHFIYGAKAREAYRDAGIQPAETQLVSALGRADLFQETKRHDDATLSYALYQSFDIKQRFIKPERLKDGAHNRIEVVFADRVWLRAFGAYPQVLFRDTPITFQPTWIALEPLERDYEFVLRLQNGDTGAVAQEWRLRVGQHRYGYYSPPLWDVDEYVHDFHIVRLDEEALIPPGNNYVFTIGVWDPLAGAYLPLTVDGADAGEFHLMAGTHELRT